MISIGLLIILAAIGGSIILWLLDYKWLIFGTGASIVVVIIVISIFLIVNSSKIKYESESRKLIQSKLEDQNRSNFSKRGIRWKLGHLGAWIECDLMKGNSLLSHITRKNSILKTSELNNNGKKEEKTQEKED